MHRIALVVGLAVAGSAVSAVAEAQPHMTGHNLLTLADGTRIELSTKFSVDVDTGRDGTVTALNRGSIEVLVTEPPPTGDQPPPIGNNHLRVSGEFLGGPRSIDPCWMPALFLLATRRVSAEQVKAALGFVPTVTHLSGTPPPIGDTVLRVLGLLVAQANAMRPERATALARLVEVAFPPTEFPPGPCLPEQRLTETPP